MTLVRLFTLCLIGCWIVGCSITPKKPERPERIDRGYVAKLTDWVVTQKMQQFDVTGMSIAVIHDQDVIYANGYGFRDREAQLLADEHTLYRVGSITKLFTAIAIMRLVDEGKVRLDSPVSLYLPSFSIQSRFEESAPITIRQMLTHHSGLPSDYLQGACSTPQVDYHHLLESLESEFVAYPSGKVFSYSNVAYSVLGLVIESVTGQKYEDYISQNFLVPLDMKSTSLNGRLEEPDLSQAYYQGSVFDECPVRDVPASGLNSHVLDLANLAKMVHAQGHFADQQLIPTHLLDQMFVQQNKKMPLDLTKRMGLTWIFYDNYLGKTRVYGHDGRTLAHTALLLVEPSSKVSVIVLSNSLGKKGNAVFSTARDILREVWPILTDKEIKWKKYLEVPEPADFASQDLSGRYATPLGVVDIEKKSGQRYSVEVLGRKLTLKPHKKDKYSLQFSYKFLGLFPVNLGWVGRLKIQAEEIDGHSLLVGYSGTHKRLVGERVAPRAIDDIWFKRAGRYYPIENLEPDMFKIDYWELLPEADYLIARVVPMDGEILEFILLPQSEGQATVAGLGRNLGSTVFFEDKGARFLGMEFTRQFAQTAP